jgi:hypothetical protein
MADILIFPTSYLPTIQEHERLDNIQKEISRWRVDLIREWDNRHFNAGERYLSRLRFHHGIRDQWKIYPGFKGQWQPVLLLSAPS